MLNLYVGQAHVLSEGDVKRIVIGNGRVIQATALDDRQILVIPEAPGQSTLHLWGRDGRERGIVVNVVPADANRLIAEIRTMLGPAGNLDARVVGDKVVVEGGNLSDEQAARLAEVARRFPQVVNLVSRVGLERMIAMDVRMVEIRREAMRNIGVKWSSSAQGPSFGIVGDLQRSGPFRPGGAAEGATGLDVRPRVGPFATVLGLNFWVVASTESAVFHRLGCRYRIARHLLTGRSATVHAQSGRCLNGRKADAARPARSIR